MSNHTGTISAQLTLTDLAAVPHKKCFAKRHVGNLCNTDNTSAGSVQRDQTNKTKRKSNKRHKKRKQEELLEQIKVERERESDLSSHLGTIFMII